MAPFPFFNWKVKWNNNNNKIRGEEDLIVFQCRHHHHHHQYIFLCILRSRHMFDFNEDGPAPVGASLRFLNRSRPYMRLFSLSQHHLLHLVGNSQNKWACNYSPRVWWWLLSCTPRPKKKKITIEWICNQTIQKRHKEKKKKKKKWEIYSRDLAFDYC
jgi:hypothetical protein